MIVPDVNLLVYAYSSDSRHHIVSKKWFEDLMNGQTVILLPWIVSLSFLRLMTHRSILEKPMKPSDCFKLVEDWYSYENVRQVDLSMKGRTLMVHLVETYSPLGNHFYDVYLAALALENRATLHSNDNDFLRFEEEGLRYMNPLSHR